MVLIGIIVGIIVALWVGIAAYVAHRLKIGFRAALLYAPLKIAFRIDDRAMRKARGTDAPVIYAISHQSRLDPALMLALLPADTLHILDEEAARAAWLEPFRELARTIAFNAGHVFVSRRLVRHLKGKGRLAVYFPDAVEPDQKAFRLYRAVSRIALASGARIVPIHVAGSRESFASLAPKATRGGRAFPRLVMRALEPITLAEATVQAGPKRPTNALALFDRVMEARSAATDPARGVIAAVVSAALRHGPRRAAFLSGGSRISYRALLMQVRMLARRIDALEAPASPVGLMIAEPASLAAGLLAALSAGRVAAPLDAESGAAAVLAQARLAGIRHVIASRPGERNARIDEVARQLEMEGLSVLWLEELMRDIGPAEALRAQLMWRRPLRRVDPRRPAIVLPAVRTESGVVAPVVSRFNLLSEMAQLGARFGVTPADRLFCAYPPATQAGLAGLLFSFISAVPYSEPKGATVAIAPGSWFVAQAPRAADGSFAAMRAAIAGDWQVDAETLKTWQSACGFTILRAYASPLAGCIVALASASHVREGTLGRFLPGIAARFENFADIANGGRLMVGGGGVAAWLIDGTRPGEIEPRRGEWVDTGDLVSVNREGFVTRLGAAERHADIGGKLVALDTVEALAESVWPRAHHLALAVKRDEAQTLVLATDEGKAQRNALRQAARKAGLDLGHVPAELLKMDTLPTLPGGGIDRAAVAKLAATGQRRRRAA